jgi:hypothetical protein
MIFSSKSCREKLILSLCSMYIILLCHMCSICKRKYCDSEKKINLDILMDFFSSPFPRNTKILYILFLAPKGLMDFIYIRYSWIHPPGQYVVNINEHCSSKIRGPSDCPQNKKMAIFSKTTFTNFFLNFGNLWRPSLWIETSSGKWRFTRTVPGVARKICVWRIVQYVS